MTKNLQKQVRTRARSASFEELYRWSKTAGGRQRKAIYDTEMQKRLARAIRQPIG